MGEYKLDISSPPVILVPAKASHGAKISTVEARVGTFVYLMKDVTISLGLLCLLLRWPAGAEVEPETISVLSHTSSQDG